MKHRACINIHLFLLQVISGQYLPMTSQVNDVIDPYVTIEIFGISSDSWKFRTKTIRNNGCFYMFLLVSLYIMNDKA